jgi:hypothetical protein
LSGDRFRIHGIGGQAISGKELRQPQRTQPHPAAL